MKHLIILLISVSASAKTSQIITIGKGETFVIYNAANNVFNSDSKIVKARASGKNLILIAKKEGEAQVLVGSKNYQVKVIENNTLMGYQLLKSVIREMLGLKLELVNKRIILKGELLRASDWIQIAEVAQSNNIDYVFRAKLDSDIEPQIRQVLTSKLAKSILPNLKIDLSSDASALVPQDQKAYLQAYKKVLSPFGIQSILSEQMLPNETVIGVKILVTEIRKKSFQRLGIKWPSSYQAQVIPTYSGASSEFSLQALEEEGLAKVLASPHIICRSGKEAQFLAGGEIPIKIVSQKFSDVIWKKYGVLLNVKPKADLSGHMSIQLTTEVSTIDTSQTIDGIPGFLTNRISSHFDLESSRTIVLSGLIKNESGNSSEGLPLLSRIPILGALFSSKEFRSQQSELVILVTPKILEQSSNNPEQN